MSSYNLESVFEMAGDDQDFVKIVIQTFVEEIPPDIVAMNEAIKEENASLAYQYAHKMKPNFQMFGLELMAQIKTIEEWSRYGKSQPEVEKAAREINIKVDSAISELKNDFDL